jgi:hypothetical protein
MNLNFTKSENRKIGKAETLRGSAPFVSRFLAFTIFAFALPAFPQTPVFFPLTNMFGGAWTGTVTINAANPLLNGGSALQLGGYVTVNNAGTNPTVPLWPNNYVANFSGVKTALRFTVYPSTNVLNVLSLITNAPAFFSTQPLGSQYVTTNTASAAGQVPVWTPTGILWEAQSGGGGTPILAGTNVFTQNIGGSNQINVPVVSFDAPGAAQAATNGLANGAFTPTNKLDLAGAGMASAQAATNGLGSAAFTSSTVYDAAGAAQAATNHLANGAFASTNAFDLAGQGAASALAATNGLGSAAFTSSGAYDPAGAANAVTNGLLIPATRVTGPVTASNLSGTITASQVTGLTNGSSALKVIHDDDFMDDWDYGATEALEMNLVNQGVYKLLALGCDAPPSTNQLGVGVAEMFANWYGVSTYLCNNTNPLTSNLPIPSQYIFGSYVYFPPDYIPIYTNFAHIYNTTNSPNTTRTYRYSLANSGGNVVWIGTGEFDTLAQLLSSPADDLSPLTGWQLWSNNVIRAVFMAGDYPSPAYNGMTTAEHNLLWSSLAGLQCIATLPTNVPVYWCGYTLGNSTISLGNSYWMGLLNTNSPTWQLFNYYSTNTGRASWDATAVWIAAFGTNFLGSNYFTAIRGFDTVITNGITNTVTYGSNYFTIGAGNQYYISNAAPVAFSNSLNETIVKVAPAWSAVQNSPETLSPTYPGLTILNNAQANFPLLVETTVSGSFNITAIGFVRGDYANGYAQLRYGTYYNGGISNQWSVGLRAGNNNYGIWDELRNFNPLLVSSNNDSVNIYSLQATNLTLAVTNTGPTFTAGSTVPRLWIPFTNGTTVYYLPGY